MTDSDETTKILRIVDKRIEDSGIHAVVANVKSNNKLLYWFLGVFVVAALSGAGFARTISEDVGEIKGMISVMRNGIHD